MSGIHAALDRMPSDFDWTAQNIAQAFPGGDADLALHQIDPCDQMLYLDTSFT
jgi:hypothetical protein